MSVTTKIEFDNHNRTYYSGQVMRGRVTLELPEEKLLRGIYLKIHGFGHCEWKHYDHGNPANHKAEGNETYIDERIYMVGSEEATATDLCVAAGTYTYPFECQLPVEVPSSIETDVGAIKYVANLVLDRPSWQIPTPDFLFTVIKPFDLSTDFSVHEPLTKEIQENFLVCCLICCWESKSMSMIVHIPKSGFIPNETIDVNVDVKNPSTEDLAIFLIEIVRTIKASANDGKERAETKETVLIQQCLDSLDSGEDRNMNAKIVVPTTPPTDVTSSNIFQLSYSLRITAVTGLCHEDVILNIPIKIGTDNDRRSNELNASERARQPIVFQPTAPPTDGATERLLTKSAHRNSKTKITTIIPSDPPTYEEATTSLTSKNLNKLHF